jgi:peptide/nickel transport system substrate-binding protein
MRLARWTRRQAGASGRHAPPGARTGSRPRRAHLGAIGAGLGLLLLAAVSPAAAQTPGTFSLPLIDNARMWPIVGGLPIIEPHQVPAVQRFGTVQIADAPQVNYTFIGFNNKLEPFADRKVRQALSYAIDRQAVLDKIYVGKGRLATGPINPLVAWAYTDAVDQYRYDPALAQKLLDEAGWARGPDGIRRKGGQPLKFTLDFDRGNPVREQTAVVARQYRKDIGVDVELRVSEFNALLTRIRTRPNPLQAWVLWYITPPEADLLAYYHSQGTLNEFGYGNPEVDRLLAEGRATFDQKERARLYQQAQKLIAADAPVVYLVYPAEIQALSRRIQSWVPMGYRDALTHMLGVSAAR